MFKRLPCGTLTAATHKRKRHDWVVDRPDGVVLHFGEMYRDATDMCLRIPGCKLALWLDGVPLCKSSAT